MRSIIIFTIVLSFSFLSGFLFARVLYISAINKKTSMYRKIISSFKEKYLSIFKRNNILEQKLKQLQPNLISIDAIFEQIIVSKN